MIGRMTLMDDKLLSCRPMMQGGQRWSRYQRCLRLATQIR